MQTISNGQKSVIQASRRLRDLAKASVYGSLVGLVTAIPLYYYFGLKGIVPSLIIVPLTGLILSWFYSRKLDIKPVKMSWKETLSSGENMIKLGLVITVTGIIGFFTGYILNAFISRTGGVDQVGLYNAGWSVIGQSTGLVFAAMTTDYFPRLSSINKDDSRITTLVNQQAEMVLLILGPILVLLIGTMSILIRLLYTPAFLPVVIFANWMLLGILFKGLVWPVGFIFPAKGDLKAFGMIEISAMTFNIIINILGYYLYGLEGLGVSFLVGYLFGLALTLFYAKRKYGFRYNKLTIRLFIISLILVITVFSTSYYLDGAIRFSLGAVIFIISAGYSLYELNKKLDLRHLVSVYVGKRLI